MITFYFCSPGNFIPFPFSTRPMIWLPRTLCLRCWQHLGFVHTSDKLASEAETTTQASQDNQAILALLQSSRKPHQRWMSGDRSPLARVVVFLGVFLLVTTLKSSYIASCACQNSHASNTMNALRTFARSNIQSSCSGWLNW